MTDLYRKIESEFDSSEREAEINTFWDKHAIFQKSLELRANSPRFIFYEGPPTANGMPHIGHAIARTIKDTVCRFKTMKGYLVERKAGWDTHGLPVELEVEKMLGISTKDQIEKMGIEKFNAECKKSVFKYKAEWDEYTRKLGYWLDLSNPYITYTNDYVETVWWILKKFWESKLLYKGFKILPWCPRCETALSSHEVAQGYKEISDPSIYVTIKVAGTTDTYFLVWTTTPWTLISNVALALNPSENYVTVQYGDSKLILAEPRLGVLQGSFEIIDRKKGSEYRGIKYEPLYSFMKIEKGHYVATADFVTMEDGSGIVHIAPAFGADDYELGMQEDLPVVQAVDIEGHFVKEVTPWAGWFVKKADPEIIKDLERRGLLFHSTIYTHNYPFCWRCDTPLLYYARSSWFVRTTAFKDKMIEANNKIAWYPEEVGKGRFGEWLENNIDWALSRERYWGTPLPVWLCEKCEAEHCIGSIDELRKMAVDFPKVDDPYKDFDLHRPFIDNIHLKCPSCGGTMTRVTEVIDTWFDSGSMPYGQVHYPFEHQDDFEKRFFPAELIAEGLDQTRGWFYSMLAISVFISGRSSYKSCVVNNLILDSEGRKMSKRVGNVIDPKKLLADYGADAVRWYLMSASQVWLPKRFDEKSLNEVIKRFFSTLQNSYSFYALYANIDRFRPAESDPPARERTQMDRWILSRLQWMISEADESLAENDITRCTRAIADFTVDDLSNWYVRRSRRRFWGSSDDHDKKSAYQTLFECLITITRLMAPVAPFLSEDLYRRLTENLGGHLPSVHLNDFPKAEESLRDKSLEEEMEIARKVVELGRAARKDSSMRVRQPLSRLVALGLSDIERQMLKKMESIVADEINIKRLDFDNNEAAYFSMKAEPDFKSIGPKFGPRVNEIAGKIKSMTRDQISKLMADERFSWADDGHVSSIEMSDVRIKIVPAEGYSVSADGRIKVALDLRLDDDLVAEGNARELVNRIQNMRKAAGLEVTDRIMLGISRNAETEKALAKFSEYIKSETLTEHLTDKSELRQSQEFELNGIKTVIALERI
ncbi:MAG: isoleucine--tRNA ligase [candidate division Zixibacteria bacterium RBG_16_53_22]|nr:MAG: isoleucine--tRNA ligase [candidate division Zixibacteria bacterium RBG_16_53_22]